VITKDTFNPPPLIKSNMALSWGLNLELESFIQYQAVISVQNTASASIACLQGNYNVNEE